MPLNRLICATAALAAMFALPPAQSQTKTLRFVAHADLKILDPGFSTVYISRNFGYMVYDSLFALDSNGKPQPQMVDSYAKSADGLSWTFTLRPALKFSDGKAVTSADVVASIERWALRDAFGAALKKAGAQWLAVDAKTFRLALKLPFDMLLDALAKPSSFALMVLPQRLAQLPTSAPLNEVVGSGPYLFKRDEWVPGNKTVFVRNPDYVPRKEPPSGLAGSKKGHFDRIEWLYLPDSNSAIAALRNGEVDVIEQLPADFIAPLLTDDNVKLLRSGVQQGQLVMNHLHPPFDNPKVRQAVLQAVNQERFMAAIGYPVNMRMAYCATFFICGSANETAAGSQPYQKADLPKARQMLADSGYKGEKVVLLVASDVTYLNALSLVMLQTMKSIGLNVEPVTMDWASIGARRARRNPPQSGGWSAYTTVANELSVNSPMVNIYLSAACGNSLPGWPCDQKLDALRSAWLHETDAGKRRQLLDDFQIRSFATVPYVSLGQYESASVARKEIKGTDKLWAGIPNLWVLDK